MLAERLRLALDRGLVTLPDDGRIGVFGARAEDDLTALPRDRVEVIQRLYPDNAALSEAGYETRVSADGPYALSVVVVPRAKAEARERLAEARRRTSGPVIVDGAKTDGVDAILKALRKVGDVGEVISKAHGKLFVLGDADLSDWTAAPASLPEGFETAAGVFSADGVDPGSAALAEALPKDLAGHVVDLGAGWGYLSRAILERPGVTHLDLVEADHAALDLARRNVTDERAAFHWADARTWVPEHKVDAVVTNPPFHTGRRTEASLGQAFIEASARMLKRSGRLWLVANRHLPYERTLQDSFDVVRQVGEQGPYKLFVAERPRQAGSSRRTPKG